MRETRPSRDLRCPFCVLWSRMLAEGHRIKLGWLVSVYRCEHCGERVIVDNDWR